MTLFTALFGIVVGFVLIAMTSRRRLVIAGAVTAAISTISVLYLSDSALSMAKSIRLETAKPAEAEVLWYAQEPGRRLLVLLSWPGSGGPRYYEAPWSEEVSQKLQNAATKAKARHLKLLVKNPFDGGLKAGPPGAAGSGPQGRGRKGRPGNATGSGTADEIDDIDSSFYSPPQPPDPEKEHGQEEG